MRIFLTVLCLLVLLACDNTARGPVSVSDADTLRDSANDASCLLVEDGFGPAGTVEVQAEVVVSGLEVPWGIAFIGDGDMLVTERPGRIRLVQDGSLQPDPVATIPAVARGEGGLLGIAAHPDFESNRYFYIYYTSESGGATTNRVERWVLSDDMRSASRDRTIVENIPASRYHNGGRLRFGPDGMLYVGTGDGSSPGRAQDRNSLGGKLLRLTPDGEVPPDNPYPNSPVYLTGIRNTQGFDWPNESTIWLVDHGPSGELGRRAHDEVNVATAGANLGWPEIYSCETREGMVTPSLTWEESVPPGGAAVYRGNNIPAWQGDLIVGTLGSMHLHRVVFETETGGPVETHEVYLRGNQPSGFGRLRDVIMGPDGFLYLTTSNCDGRASCPSDGDKILRIIPDPRG